jgi:hypothetical protein
MAPIGKPTAKEKKTVMQDGVDVFGIMEWDPDMASG